MAGGSSPQRIRFWIYVCLFYLLAFSAIHHYSPQYYGQKEADYRSPVGEAQQPLQLRHDKMGKGHFGASRSRGRRHTGIDIEANMGEFVYATKSGRVQYAGTKGGYGLFVRIEHPDGLNTRYAHLSEIGVKSGSWVDRGQVIGAIGKTGNALHPAIKSHLHFEVRQREDAVDPTLILPEAA